MDAKPSQRAWDQLRPVLDSLPDVIWWEARYPAFELTHVSEGVKELLGFDASQLTKDGKLWPGRIQARDRNKVLRARELAATIGSYEDLEYRLTRSDGRIIWVRENAVTSPDGHLHGLTKQINDRKRTEERLGFLVKASTILSSTLAPEKLVSKVARMIVGSLADLCIIELLGNGSQGAMVVVRGQSKRNLAASMQADGPTLARKTGLLRRLRGGQAIVLTRFSGKELSLLAANDRQEVALRKAKPHAALIVPMIVRSELLGAMTLLCFNPETYTAGDVQLAEDLGRRAAAAIQNAGLYTRSEEANEDLARQNAAKDEFLAIMSHELRSPLTTIYGNSRLMARGALPLESADGQQMVQDMAESAERAVRLADDLMLLARVHLGEQLVLEPMAVKPVIQAVTAEFTSEHPEREVLVDAARNVEPVLASQTYVRQVLLNLLGNAHKYCPPSTLISVRARTGDDESVISVADAGEGLPQEE